MTVEATEAGVLGTKYYAVVDQFWEHYGGPVIKVAEKAGVDYSPLPKAFRVIFDKPLIMDNLKAVEDKSAAGTAVFSRLLESIAAEQDYKVKLERLFDVFTFFICYNLTMQSKLSQRVMAVLDTMEDATAADLTKLMKILSWVIYSEKITPSQVEDILENWESDYVDYPVDWIIKVAGLYPKHRGVEEQE